MNIVVEQARERSVTFCYRKSDLRKFSEKLNIKQLKSIDNYSFQVFLNELR